MNFRSWSVAATLGLLLLGSFGGWIYGVHLGELAKATPSVAGDRTDLDAALAEVRYGDTEAWFLAWKPFMTDKWPLSDAAEGWSVLAICLGVAFIIGVWRVVRSAPHPFTPTARFTAPLLLAAAGVAQFPLIANYFVREIYERECCPNWADTPIIPIASWSIATVLYLVVFEAALGLLLFTGRLPAPLVGTRSTLKRQILTGLLVLPLLSIALLVSLTGLAVLPSLVALGLTSAWALLVGRAASLQAGAAAQ